MNIFSRAGISAFGALWVLLVVPSQAALEVVLDPGSNTSPAGTVTTHDDVIDVPSIPLLVINRNALFSTVNAGGISSVYLFRATDNPLVVTNIAGSQFTFYQDNNGAASFLAGAQAGDDNWLYMTRSVNDSLVYNGWLKVAITANSFTPVLYVHDPVSPTTLISLPEAVAATQGSPRDVQIKSVDFETGIIELHNFGSSSQSLNGWRFCTHDENQVRRYSGSTGLNGITIEAGTSLNIYFNNDAPTVNSDNINRSTTGGGWAEPLDSGSYAIGLYFQTSFGVGANIADHVQWSPGGVDNLTADERSDEAQSGGVWDDQSTWIDTSSSTRQLYLTDVSGGELQGASDYLVLPDFGINVISRNDAANEVTLGWPTVNNLSVTVESASDLSVLDWPDEVTTNSDGVTLSGQSDTRAFYRLEFSLP